MVSSSTGTCTPAVGGVVVAGVCVLLLLTSAGISCIRVPLGLVLWCLAVSALVPPHRVLVHSR